MRGESANTGKTTSWADQEKTKRRMNPKLAERVAGCRKIATEMRLLAKNQYEKISASASHWEHYANMLEQGYSDEEADRRAFGGRLTELRKKRAERKVRDRANA